MINIFSITQIILKYSCELFYLFKNLNNIININNITYNIINLNNEKI